MKRLPYFLFILLVFSLQAYAEPELPADHSIRTWMAEHNVPALSIGIIDQGKIQEIKVFGEYAKGRPTNTDTLFSIASQTKPLVAMMVLKLVEAGQWDLDQPLYPYWVDPDVAGHPFHKILTSRHILSHSSGFRNWRRNAPNKTLTFDFKPGTQFQYSGEGMEYLRRALESKFALPLDKLMKKTLLEPLQMTRTQYWEPGLSNYARWYDSHGKEYQANYNNGVGAAGGIWTTVEDYLKFGLYTMALKESSALQYQAVSKPQTEIKKDSYFSIGWGLITNLSDGEYAIHHGGTDLGVRTSAIFLPESEQGIVVMSNGDGGAFVQDKIIASTLSKGKEVLQKINSKTEQLAPTQIPKKIIEQYSGTYVQPDGRAFIISALENAIQVSGKETPRSVLIAASPNSFYLADYDVKFTFIKSATQNDYQLNIYENGNKVSTAERQLPETLINNKKWTAVNRNWQMKGQSYYANRQSGDGILWLNDAKFTHGTIELDIKGNDIIGKSFVGIAFNGIGDNDYDAIYLRPFNFNRVGKEDNSIQYISLPKYTWPYLRKNHPGKYENKIVPAPSPNDWVHLKIQIAETLLEVFINHSEEPSLTFEPLRELSGGKVGFWVGNRSDGYFKNLVLTPDR